MVLISETKRILREWSREDLKALCDKYNNWGKWGLDDEVGTLNFITPEKIVKTAQLIKRGKAFSLAIPLNLNVPLIHATIEEAFKQSRTPRWSPLHVMLRTGNDPPYMGGRFADDAIITPTHAGTHWDGLAHVFSIDGKMWNGYDASLVTSAGALKNGIEKLRDKVVSKGVLLDIARCMGVEHLEPGFEILPEDLDECADKEGVKIERGDFVIIRTGHMAKYLRKGDWGDYAGGYAPGLTLETVEWIYKKEIAGIASDTWAVEVIPHQVKGLRFPWHHIVIPCVGLLVGENFYLEELAEDCYKDNIYEFFFTAPVLPITGAVGSPINPLAIK